MRRHTFQYCLMLIMLIFAACSEEAIIPNKPVDKTKSKEEITLYLYTMPPSTKAMTVAEESYVNELDILVFNSSTQAYEYYAKGENITDERIESGMYVKSFTATLKNDGVTYDFVVIANANAQVRSIIDVSTGDYIGGGATDKASVLAKLTMTEGNPPQWNTTVSPVAYFPMWGETTGSVSNGVNNFQDVMIRLLRSVAKVDVHVDKALIASGKFRLQRVYTYNRTKEGYVVPYATNYVKVQNKVIAPTPKGAKAVYPSTAGTVLPPASYFYYGNAAGFVDKDSIYNTIYLFEAEKSSSNDYKEMPCLVIGGFYEGNAALSYYRADYYVNGDGFWNIMRNHWYDFKITAVADQGFSTPDSAYLYKRANIGLEILEWNTGSLDSVPVIKQDHLELSRYSYSLVGMGSTFTDYITVTTDCPDGWSYSSQVTSGTATILISEPATLSGNASGERLKFTMTKTSGTATGIIRVTAGNVTKEVKITITTF